MANMKSTHMEELPTELQENTLHFLPTKDLLFAQKVCRRWNEVINSSKKLQQDLFLIPEEPTEGWMHTTFRQNGESIGDRVDIVAPEEWKRYGKGMSDLSLEDCELPADPSITCERYLVPRGRLNPLFLQPTISPGSIMIDIIYDGSTFVSRWIESHEKKPNLSKIPPKYRDMFLTQPPVRFMESEIMFLHDKGRCADEGPEVHDRGSNLCAVVTDVQPNGTFTVDVHIVITKDEGITIGNIMETCSPAESYEASDKVWMGGWLVFGGLLCENAEQDRQLRREQSDPQAMFQPSALKQDGSLATANSATRTHRSQIKSSSRTQISQYTWKCKSLLG